MSTRFSRPTAVALALVLCLTLLPAAAHARPSRAAVEGPHGAVIGAISDLLSWAWQALIGRGDGARGSSGMRSATAPEGVSIDPNGNHLTGGSPAPGGQPLAGGPGGFGPQS